MFLFGSLLKVHNSRDVIKKSVNGKSATKWCAPTDLPAATATTGYLGRYRVLCSSIFSTNVLT